MFPKGHLVPTVFSAIFTVVSWPLEMFRYDVFSHAKRLYECDLAFLAHPFVTGGAYQEVPDQPFFDILHIFVAILGVYKQFIGIIYIIPGAMCHAGLRVGWGAQVEWPVRHLHV